MSKELTVPVDNRTADWPRRAANATNYLLRERAALVARVEALETAVAALNARLTAAEADIADHETRIAALETP